MPMPAFFDAAPRIVVHDPLAAFLGAPADGEIEYCYADAVRLAGHSCPTVASAWLMTRAALLTLYPDTLPERGGIEVAMRGRLQDGVNGVMANVVSLVTGAATQTGFKGIGGRFERRGLFSDDAQIDGDLRFTRAADRKSVTAQARIDRVAFDPRVPRLMQRRLAGTATPDEEALFQLLWPGQVEQLLSFMPMIRK
ncbi:MAG: hypothetical protein R3E68_18360 [Burkholderiaceae bacterium]